jgi:GH43 family beta-xylosidase
VKRFAIAVLAVMLGGSSDTPQSFTNPLLPSGPDPWITR